MAALAEVTKRTDEAIRKDVMFELQWDPKLADCDIAVAVNDGIVTLNGVVPSFWAEYEAEKAAKRVYGVRAVVNQIERARKSGRAPLIKLERSSTICDYPFLYLWFERKNDGFARAGNLECTAADVAREGLPRRALAASSAAPARATATWPITTRADRNFHAVSTTAAQASLAGATEQVRVPARLLRHRDHSAENRSLRRSEQI